MNFCPMCVVARLLNLFDWFIKPADVFFVLPAKNIDW